MKIGIFTDSYLPYTSGVVRSIVTFKEELISNGHEVYIFAPSYDNCVEEEGVFRFSSIKSPTNRDFTLAWPFSFEFGPMVKKLDLDLIHVHSPFLLGRLGASYARKLDIPLVFTYHTLYEQYVHYLPFAGTLAKDITQHISRSFSNRCDLVIVPTAAIETYLRKIGVTAPIKAVPTGIKVEDFLKGEKDWLKKRFDMPGDEKVLIFVGRLGQEKNVHFLLDCFLEINKKFANTRLVLVGSGPEDEELKKKAQENGIERKVTFTGLIPPADVIHCYAGSDIFVFPSVTETQGIVIPEAKAAGLPVVAIDAYGAADMVEHEADGFLTELDQNQFVQRVLQLLEDPDLYQRMSAKARLNAENISTHSCTKKLIACYEQVLTSPAALDKKELPSIGAFSLSLTVKDLKISKEFYEKLGFHPVGGDMEQNWLIMRNADCTIGLFQGMFEQNTLTFNPGWNDQGENTELFTDVRKIQEVFRAKGIEIIQEVDPNTTGPGFIFTIDPDGNPILIDQHR